MTNDQASRRRVARWPAVALALLVVLALTGIGEARAMGKMCMFSAVQGVVTQHGKPVAGAVIERRFKWAWKDETGVDRTQTDAEGRFRFDPIWRSSLLGGLLPHEPSVEQELHVLQGDHSYLAWQFVRDSYKESSELFGRPIRLHCELDSAARPHLLEHNYVRHSIYGICDLEGTDDMQGGLSK